MVGTTINLRISKQGIMFRNHGGIFGDMAAEKSIPKTDVAPGCYKFMGWDHSRRKIQKRLNLFANMDRFLLNLAKNWNFGLHIPWPNELVLLCICVIVCLNICVFAE